MDKKYHSARHKYRIRRRKLRKRQFYRMIATVSSTLLLFTIIEMYLISSHNRTDSQTIPDEVKSAYHEDESTAMSSDLPDSDVSLVLESDSSALMSAVSDKAGLLSVIDALPADESTLLSVPTGFCSAQNNKLQQIIDGFHKEDYNISFILLDINSGNVFCLNPDFCYYGASVIKGPYVAALNLFCPELIFGGAEELMENAIRWSSNEDYERLYYLYGNDPLYEMTQYTNVSDSIIDDSNWYPYLTPKELTKLWIGIYWYFFVDTNEFSESCRDLYTDSTESFICSALSEDYTIYSKPGWFIDWEDESRNDAGIILSDDNAYILTIMSDDYDSYDELEELAAVLVGSIK